MGHGIVNKSFEIWGHFKAILFFQRRHFPDFSFDKFVERMLGPFEQVCDFVESAVKEAEIFSNVSRIKFEFDQTFAQLPFDFFFVLKKVGSYRNRLNTSTFVPILPNIRSTLVE